jgi:hypothetical protein
MAYAHLSGQAAHMPCPKYILYQAIVLSQVEFAIITRHYACRILTPVLQYCQCVIDTHTHIITGYNAN